MTLTHRTQIITITKIVIKDIKIYTHTCSCTYAHAQLNNNTSHQSSPNPSFISIYCRTDHRNGMQSSACDAADSPPPTWTPTDARCLWLSLTIILSSLHHGDVQWSHTWRREWSHTSWRHAVVSHIMKMWVVSHIMEMYSGLTHGDVQWYHTSWRRAVVSHIMETCSGITHHENVSGLTHHGDVQWSHTWRCAVVSHIMETCSGLTHHGDLSGLTHHGDVQCWHVGDLARMVTDNRDMVLSKLHDVHARDIAYMERIRGNLI